MVVPLSSSIRQHKQWFFEFFSLQMAKIGSHNQCSWLFFPNSNHWIKAMHSFCSYYVLYMRFYIILFNISQNRHVNDCAVTYPSPFNNVQSSAVVKINGSWQRLVNTVQTLAVWCVVPINQNFQAHFLQPAFDILFSQSHWYFC